jgi:hypothetical protein
MDAIERVEVNSETHDNSPERKALSVPSRSHRAFTASGAWRERHKISVRSGEAI